MEKELSKIILATKTLLAETELTPTQKFCVDVIIDSVDKINKEENNET